MDTAEGQARVRWTTGDGRAMALTLWPERPVTIGRDATSTIVLDSPFVSKQHAIVTWTEGEFQIADSGSANGTRVNGTAVTAAALHDGDIIEIGDYQLAFDVAAADDQTDDPRTARAAPVTGGNKMARLLIAALATMMVMIGGLALALGPSRRPTPRARSRARRARCRRPRRAR